MEETDGKERGGIFVRDQYHFGWLYVTCKRQKYLSVEQAKAQCEVSDVLRGVVSFGVTHTKKDGSGFLKVMHKIGVLSPLWDTELRSPSPSSLILSFHPLLTPCQCKPHSSLGRAEPGGWWRGSSPGPLLCHQELIAAAS